jgi:DNA modification methylase
LINSAFNTAELTLLISSFTNRGDLVLEPFSGSGPACVVAKRLGRNFIGCDINPGAVKEARKWIKEEDLLQRSYLKGGGVLKK